jgi:phosphonoacetaldehyde hydrolase
VIRAVIFDWAGTIVDHGSVAPAESFMRLFAGRGVTITVAEARAPMGQGKRDHIQAIATAVAERWAAAHGGRGAASSDIDAMYADFVPLQIEAIAARAGVIPGAREAFAALRQRGIRVGTTTGYSREMVAPLAERARAQGLEADCVVCASDVARGRPAPWMALEAARRLDVFPMRAIVKVGDTVADIDEGRNAGMWSVGVAASGNEVGLDEAGLAALGAAERRRLIDDGAARLRAAGAHEVIESVADLGPLLERIEARLARGENP